MNAPERGNDRAVTTPEEWVNTVVKAIREFGRVRRSSPPSVEATLADGETFYVFRIDPGPGELVTLYPIRAGGELVHDEERGEVHTPEAIIVHPQYVRKIRLLIEPPSSRQAIGFAPD